MKAVIVGHGPSLIDTPRGKEIDKYDVVIQVRPLEGADPKYYGKRSDYRVLAWRWHFEGSSLKTDEHYDDNYQGTEGEWLHWKWLRHKQKDVSSILSEYPGVDLCDRECNQMSNLFYNLALKGESFPFLPLIVSAAYSDQRYYNSVYRVMRHGKDEDPIALPPLPSIGTAAVYLTAVKLLVRQIDLIGFDNIRDSNNGEYYSNNHTLEEGEKDCSSSVMHPKYGVLNHDFRLENRFIQFITELTGIPIHYI